MTGQSDLSGHRVMVVEDEYLIASYTARALRDAGAEVIGPCPSEWDARVELEVQRPHAAIVDINLGNGPSFEVAAALTDEGIPFVFVTGYDQESIPGKFEKVERLQKPVELRQIV